MHEQKYANIDDARLIVLDIETFDPNLLSLGAGVYRNDGYIIGVSIATDTGFKEYFDLGHPECTPTLRKNNIEYLRKVLALPVPKLGTNILYDVDWLENWKGDKKATDFRRTGVELQVEGTLYDIQVAEALIDENQQSYHLDALAKKYLGVGKVSDKPVAFCAKQGWKGDFRKWLYKMPYELVRDYALGDVLEPLMIFDKQWTLMKEQGLIDIFKLETKLLRAVLFMRKTGAIVSPRRRDVNAYMAQSERERREIAFEERYGKVNLNSTQQLAKLFDSIGIEYNYKLTYLKSNGDKIQKRITSTDAKAIFAYVGGSKVEAVVQKALELTDGSAEVIRSCNPTIDKEFLEGLERDMENLDLPEGDTTLQDILFIRKADKIVGSFLRGPMVSNLCADGRIHPDIHATRSDAGGTRTGRFSMSNPNLQQIPSPSRNKYWGTLCRECFVPDKNCWWGKIDYSQIEYRVLAHYASGEGADELRARYNEDPHTDYHQYIVDLTGLSRSYAKNLNFGGMYGMGKKKMAYYFKWSMEYATEILNTYHGNAPYIKFTMNSVSTIARARGFIRTLAGRHAHLADKDKAYKMVNSLIQGSAADIAKKAMLDIYESGILNVLQNHITVHDEFDFSVPKTAEGLRAFFKAQELMENAYALRVPIKAEAEIGVDWGHLNLVDFTDININKEEWLAGLTDANCEAELQRVIDACKVVEDEKERKKKAEKAKELEGNGKTSSNKA